MVYTHRSPMYLPRKQREIGGCGSTAVCRLSASATLTRTTSELNDSRQVHSLPLKHLRPRVLKQPPHYLFICTLFGAAGCGKQAENIHQFSFASKARLFSLRYITSCGVFFLLVVLLSSKQTRSWCGRELFIQDSRGLLRPFRQLRRPQ